MRDDLKFYNENKKYLNEEELNFISQLSKFNTNNSYFSFSNNNNLNSFLIYSLIQNKAIQANFIIKNSKKLIEKYIKEVNSDYRNKKFSYFDDDNEIDLDYNQFLKEIYNKTNTKLNDYTNNVENAENDGGDSSNVKASEINYTLPRWPLLFLFIGGMICMGFSATFHLFTAHSKIVKRVMNRMDYAGIAILIVFSCYPPYYYYFYCNKCKFL